MSDIYFKRLDKHEAPKSEKPPTGREWTDEEKEKYYSNLSKPKTWTEWYQDVIKMLYEKKKITYTTVITNDIKKTLYEFYTNNTSKDDVILKFTINQKG